MDASEDYVSKRIIIGDSIGTILFYGEVPPTKGLWFGVDWDDPTRGKNDGSIGGLRYFQARTPTSGSFIRASNVDFGVSFLSAVRNKYEEIRDDSSPSVDVSNLSSLMKNIHARFVEVVGLDKVRQQQSCLDQLQVAILRNQRISSSDEKEEIMRICPSIRELDLSKNLIPSWEVVAEITSALTNLTSLNVSENRLPVPPRISELCESFSNLTHLVLARMGYTWEDVEPLLQLTPNLQHLQVPWNNINKLNQPSTSVKLNSIDLSGNPINDWNEINKLGNMKSLEVLNCAGTQIKEIRFPGEVYLPADYFQSLEKLYIQETPIYEYQSINELNRTGKLEVLRITQCPILNLHNPDTARQLMIAKISTLKILNGKEISATERKSSETDYMKMALVEKIKHSLSENDFKNMHPRYAALIDQLWILEC